MMIVDSNAWADFFNGSHLPHVERLDAALRDEEDLAVLPIIVTEVLQGFRTDRGFRSAERVLVSLPSIQPIPGLPRPRRRPLPLPAPAGRDRPRRRRLRDRPDLPRPRRPPAQPRPRLRGDRHPHAAATLVRVSGTAWAVTPTAGPAARMAAGEARSDYTTDP